MQRHLHDVSEAAISTTSYLFTLSGPVRSPGKVFRSTTQTSQAKTDKNMDKVTAMLEQAAKGNSDLRKVLGTKLERVR
jgi:hypothetical protein